MEPDLAASIMIKNKNNVWINDNMVTHCHGCENEFGYFTRKHHCRNCGNIFCYGCSNKYIVIPKFIADRPDPADYWNPSYYISALKGHEEKVCQQCYDIIKEKTRAYEKIMQMINNPIPIDKLKELSGSNSDVKNHYFDQLRNIQYYLPHHKYNDIDKKLLRINAPYFSKHSKYLVHIIKSIEWDKFVDRDIQTNQEQLQYIIGILNSDKNKKCSELYCTRTCQEVLSCDDCVNILYSCVNYLPNELTEYFFNIIMKTPEIVLLCHLPFFITLVKGNATNKLLQNCLFRLLNRTDKMRYHVYWFLNNAKQETNVTMQELTNINNFIELLDPAAVKKMESDYVFFVGLVDNLDDPKKYLLANFNRYKPVTIPYDPKIEIIGLDLDNIINKNSYTKPVIIPFETTSGRIKLLFKKECVMNDVTVLNLMTLCDIVLGETLKLDFGVVVYPIMPLTANSGMIEIIDKAETIHSINNRKQTIFQYIMERNENRVVGDVMNRYMYSLVSYTLHSYFLGLGDRHLQNIMITEDGAIFHIDFGFILGTDAYPLTGSDIKLNSDMLDAIGGADSGRYKTYLDLCAKGVIILRKYFNMFFILLCQNSKFKAKHIEKFIMSRFQPRQIDNVVVTELMAVIRQSHDAYSDLIKDFLHYHTQEKTVQHGIGRIMNVAFGAMKSITSSTNSV